MLIFITFSSFVLFSKLKYSNIEYYMYPFVCSAAYEATYGKIPRGAIVMMNSGWASKYPDAVRVFGSDNINDPSTFHFPGFSIEACRFLLTERQVGPYGQLCPCLAACSCLQKTGRTIRSFVSVITCRFICTQRKVGD